MTLDLSYARTIAEQYMVDRCRVRRDPEGPLNDTLDPNTLEYAEDPGTVLYEGRCLVSRPTRRDTRNSEGGQSVHRRGMKVRFPVSAPRFKLRDMVEIVASPDPQSNAQLVGQKFRVIEPDDRSLVASRIVLVEDDTGARAR